MTIQIFDTGYAWNWLYTFNQFLGGITWGAGLVFAFLIFIVFVNRTKK